MSLAGSYSLHPGAAHSIRGQRPVVGDGRLGLLLRGLEQDAGVKMLGLVLTFCAHAQRHTASLAWSAAKTQQIEHPDAQTALSLRLETARDHLRSMALDWSARLDARHQMAKLQWTKHCPVALIAPAHVPNPEQAENQLRKLHEWLEMPTTRASVLQVVVPWQESASALRPTTRPLDVLDANSATQATNLQELAFQLREQTGFAQMPVWKGHCVETGVWTRLRDRDQDAPQHSLWTRLLSRWTEIRVLASRPQDETLLQSGAMPLGAGQAIAWCEMARGLLLHWVRLGVDNRVMDYRIIAPTEWNFHPQGALAQALRQLPVRDSSRAALLVTAYDPCVECEIKAAQERDNHA